MPLVAFLAAGALLLCGPALPSQPFRAPSAPAAVIPRRERLELRSAEDRRP